MTNLKEIIVGKAGAILNITLNKPEKRNVLSLAMLNEIREVLVRFSSDNSLRCVIIKGADGKVFSSGYDITAIQDGDFLREFQSEHPLEECLKEIENFPYPVIAVMNGHAFGAGLELAITCDLRICANTAKVGMPPVRLGLSYTYSGVKKFLNLLGVAHTKELFLIGKSIDAVRAEKIGLVNYISNEYEIEEFSNALATEITNNAPLSLTTIKQSIDVWQRNQNVQQEDNELLKTLFEKVQQSEDLREGQKAFKERRRPMFQGK